LFLIFKIKKKKKKNPETWVLMKTKHEPPNTGSNFKPVRVNWKCLGRVTFIKKKCFHEVPKKRNSEIHSK